MTTFSFPDPEAGIVWIDRGKHLYQLSMTDQSLHLLSSFSEHNNWAGTRVGNKLYRFGGGVHNERNSMLAICPQPYDPNMTLDALYENPYNQLEVLKTKSGKLPPRRLYATAVTMSDNDRIIIFGGQSTFLLNRLPIWFSDVHVFTTSTQTWEEIKTSADRPEDIPCGRGAASSCLYNGDMIVFGGGSWKRCTPSGLLGVKYFNDVYKLDTKNWKWSKLTVTGVPPRPRAGHACCLFGHSMIISGGYLPEWHTFKDCFALDLQTLCWQPLLTLPKQLGNHSMCTYKNKILLVGAVEKWSNMVFSCDMYLADVSERVVM
eukprot:TRINITY_DN13027_c0_g2_i3.p1 TRINITY_DN13027_c0_g2~~TRINITY_DN13027_c0_g2_i3.p1  ORF type:complete len:318 (+),score=46.49 TRINITY_DN13027_c0_g2_i3:352-1305(+)